MLHVPRLYIPPYQQGQSQVGARGFWWTPFDRNLHIIYKVKMIFCSYIAEAESPWLLVCLLQILNPLSEIFCLRHISFSNVQIDDLAEWVSLASTGNWIDLVSHLGYHAISHFSLNGLFHDLAQGPCWLIITQRSIWFLLFLHRCPSHYILFRKCESIGVFSNIVLYLSIEDND